MSWLHCRAGISRVHYYICSWVPCPPHASLCWPKCIWLLVIWFMGFPGGSEFKASASNVGDLGSIPGLGRSPGEGNGNPLQYSCLENLAWGIPWMEEPGRLQSIGSQRVWHDWAASLSLSCDLCLLNAYSHWQPIFRVNSPSLSLCLFFSVFLCTTMRLMVQTWTSKTRQKYYCFQTLDNRHPRTQGPWEKRHIQDEHTQTCASFLPRGHFQCVVQAGGTQAENSGLAGWRDRYLEFGET